MIDNHSEYILCAAVHFNTGEKYANQPRNIESGVVMCGWRHCSVLCQTGMLFRDRKERFGYDEFESCEIQGFLTSKNRFVDREQAAIIAFNTGQITELKTKLYSEDIY